MHMALVFLVGAKNAWDGMVYVRLDIHIFVFICVAYLEVNNTVIRLLAHML
jgi:hypothetical protein